MKQLVVSINFKDNLGLVFKFLLSTPTGKFQVPVSRGCVLTMSGFAADEITHCIRNRLADFRLFSVTDPDAGSGAFLTLDPGSRTHIFNTLMTNFWVKSTIILSVLAKKNFFTCSKIKLFTIL